MQRENFRSYSLERLLEQLKAAHKEIDGYSFEELSQDFETPEEMTDALGDEGIYPVVLELWRRLLPERQSLSVFCHNLDFLIMEFDRGIIYPEVYEDLAELQYFLDENVDRGIESDEAFSYIQNYVESDIQGFLFSYILYEIEEGDLNYAKDLSDGFYRYMEAKNWFDYLYARVEIKNDPELGYEKLEAVVDKLILEKNDIDCEFEILIFLATAHNHSLFLKLALNTITELEVEEDFQEFAGLCKEHFESLELASLSSQIDTILENRKSKEPEEAFLQNDPDAIALKRILNQKLQLL